jgi:hypothetical protein
MNSSDLFKSKIKNKPKPNIENKLTQNAIIAVKTISAKEKRAQRSLFEVLRAIDL